MFKIIDSSIHCSRGDAGTVTLKIPITDTKNNIKYKDESGNVYWYDSKNGILYDSNYVETTIVLTTLSMVIYEFQIGDKITFNIYNKNGYNKNILMSKEVHVTAASDSIDIPLLEENTIFVNDINKPTIYWYDITLNDCMTVVGYNEDGAKEFILYPAKGGDGNYGKL